MAVRPLAIALVCALAMFSACNRSEPSHDWLDDRDDAADAEVAHDALGPTESCVPIGDFRPIELSRLDDSVREASGIVRSLADSESLWLHNDSGDAASLYRVLRDEGDVEQVVTLAGVDARDWEDIATGSCPAGIDADACLFVGDIGDNNAAYDSIFVHAIAEPEHVTGATTFNDVRSREFEFEDGPRDAEALIWWAGQVHILTKRGGGFDLYSAAWPEEQGAVPATLARVGRVQFSEVFPSVLGAGYVTAADVTTDGRYVVVRSYGSMFLFGGVEDADMLTLLSTPVSTLRTGAEYQGEAVAFTDDGVVHVAEGENVPIWLLPCP